MNPSAADIPRLTDHNFKRTREIVGRWGGNSCGVFSTSYPTTSQSPSGPRQAVP